MRVLVIGGGIGGLAAACALADGGARVRVAEARPSGGGDLGAFLTLAGNGTRALHRLGAAAAAEDCGFGLERLRVIDAGGAVAAERPLSGFRCLRWADLRAGLAAAALRRGPALDEGLTCTAVREDAGGAVAEFDDGSADRADLVIGADGVHSAVRSAIDPRGPAARYAGQNIYYAASWCTDGTGPPPPGRIDMVRGSRAAFGHATCPDGSSAWFARVPGPPLAGSGVRRSPGARERLAALLEPDATPAAATVAATSAPVLATDARDLPPGGRWHTRRVLLLGDAAHAASPATGQGASQALEDACALAGALGSAAATAGPPAGTLASALAAVERARRPAAEENTARSAELTRALSGPPDGRG
ncbi:FAD-dependent monooxygenase [Nocardiopsis coralliicola]